ncbi:MAG TPA: hypothetical protein VNG52_04795 [Stellaceae bacterium]|nr:hypothetical protein [Stellaceae bacterium]
MAQSRRKDLHGSVFVVVLVVVVGAMIWLFSGLSVHRSGPTQATHPVPPTAKDATAAH